MTEYKKTKAELIDSLEKLLELVKSHPDGSFIYYTKKSEQWGKDSVKGIEPGSDHSLYILFGL